MDDGFPAGLIIGFIAAALLVGSCVDGYSTRVTLDATKPCVKDSPIIKQQVGSDTWVCIEGVWKLL